MENLQNFCANCKVPIDDIHAIREIKVDTSSSSLDNENNNIVSSTTQSNSYPQPKVTKVHTILSSIYNLDCLKKVTSYGSNLFDGENEEAVGLCHQCAPVLTDLYKLYTKCGQLRLGARDSYLTMKIDRMNHLCQEIQSTWATLVNEKSHEFDEIQLEDDSESFSAHDGLDNPLNIVDSDTHNNNNDQFMETKKLSSDGSQQDGSESLNNNNGNQQDQGHQSKIVDCNDRIGCGNYEHHQDKTMFDMEIDTNEGRIDGLDNSLNPMDNDTNNNNDQFLKAKKLSIVASQQDDSGSLNGNNSSQQADGDKSTNFDNDDRIGYDDHHQVDQDMFQAEMDTNKETSQDEQEKDSSEMHDIYSHTTEEEEESEGDDQHSTFFDDPSSCDNHQLDENTMDMEIGTYTKEKTIDEDQTADSSEMHHMNSMNSVTTEGENEGEDEYSGHNVHDEIDIVDENYVVCRKCRDKFMDMTAFYAHFDLCKDKLGGLVMFPLHTGDHTYATTEAMESNRNRQMSSHTEYRIRQKTTRTKNRNNIKWMNMDCPVCDEGPFNCVPDTYEHLKKHLIFRSTICPICSQVCTSIRAMLVHFRTIGHPVDKAKIRAQEEDLLTRGTKRRRPRTKRVRVSPVPWASVFSLAPLPRPAVDPCRVCPSTTSGPANPENNCSFVCAVCAQSFRHIPEMRDHYTQSHGSQILNG